MNSSRPPDDNSLRLLRAAFLHEQTQVRYHFAPPTPSVAMRLAAAHPSDRYGWEQHEVAVPSVDPPTAEELLESSPNILRLCESYHRIHARMVARSRRQRVGLALMVSAMGVGGVFLNRSHAVAADIVSNLVVAVAAASVVALGLLATLWLRDEGRLRANQGERLLRALQFNCSLEVPRLEALRRDVPPTVAFFGCYALWRERYRVGPTGLQALFAQITGKRQPVSA